MAEFSPLYKGLEISSGEAFPIGLRMSGVGVYSPGSQHQERSRGR